MKVCKGCKEEKSPSCFYRNKTTRDRLAQYCKLCSSAKCREWREKNKERLREYESKRAKTEKRILLNKSYASREDVRARFRVKRNDWKKKNKRKKQAHEMVLYHLGKGTLKRSPCSVCGSLKVDAHHCDYSKPLDVMWLCRAHHMQWHRIHGEGLNA